MLSSQLSNHDIKKMKNLKREYFKEQEASNSTTEKSNKSLLAEFQANTYEKILSDIQPSISEFESNQLLSLSM